MIDKLENSFGKSNQIIIVWLLLLVFPFLVNASIVAKWDFDGDLEDSCSNHDGVGYNSPKFSDRGISETFALSLEKSSSQYITISDSVNLRPNSFTITAWARVMGSEHTSRVLVNKYDHTTNAGYIVYAHSNNKWVFKVSADSGGYLMEGPDVVSGQWVFVAAVFEQTGTYGSNEVVGDMKFYVNGQLYDTAYGVRYKPNTSTINFVVGADWISTLGFFNSFDGLVDDVRFHSHVLDSSEINDLYDAGDITIRVMTYNILYGAYQPYPDYSSEPTGYEYLGDRKDMILNHIKTYDPDILLLQECVTWTYSGNTRLQEFSDELALPYTMIEGPGSYFRVAVLSRYPIGGPIEDCQDPDTAAKILKVQADITSNRDVYVASLHFSWWDFSGWDEMTYEEKQQCYITRREALMDWLESQLGFKIIMGGDWNTDATSLMYGYGTNMHDDISNLGYGLDLLRRFHSTYNPIDTLYFSPLGMLEIIDSNQSFEDISDHYPMWADILISDDPVPVITTDPISQFINLGEEAIFTVEGLCQDNYEWYKSYDANSNTFGDDVLIGNDSNILTLTNIQPNDEGYYYCLLSNTYGSTASDVAMLLTERSVVPVFQTADLGSTVNFEVNDFSQVNYTWYKSSDSDTNTPIDDVIVGGDSNAFVLSNVRVVDEGYYYCVISNFYGSLVSDVSKLMTKRLISRWNFENNLSDYYSGYTGTRINPAIYVEGIINSKSLDFTSDVNDVVTVPFKQSLNLNNFTVSAWAKPVIDSNDMSRVVACSRNSNAGYVLYANSLGQWSFSVLASDGAHLVLGSDVVEDEWSLLTATFEPTSISGNEYIGNACLYVNGKLVNSLSNVKYQPDVSLADFHIGSDWSLSSGNFNPFYGSVDDVRYYSYALDSRQVAQLYADGTGQPVCVPGLKQDINEDCKVDFEDFAIFALNWLDDSNVYPSGM